jgi:hypothetical protein
MARARRKTAQPPEKDVQHLVVRIMPAYCPLCEARLEHVPSGTAHLQSHAPAELCQRCDEQTKGWHLDWDAVQYFRKDRAIFYCSGCGRYPAVDGSPAS